MSDIPPPQLHCFHKCLTINFHGTLQFCLVNEPVTFTSAVGACKNLGMEFVHVEDQFEREMIKELITKEHRVAFPPTVWAMEASTGFPAQ